MTKPLWETPPSKCPYCGDNLGGPRWSSLASHIDRRHAGTFDQHYWRCVCGWKTEVKEITGDDINQFMKDIVSHMQHCEKLNEDITLSAIANVGGGE